jgi:hypothetical protein
MKYIWARDLRTMRDINFHGSSSGRAASLAKIAKGRKVSPKIVHFDALARGRFRGPWLPRCFQKTLTDF